MKRHYDDEANFSMEQLITRKMELQDELNRITILEDEKLRQQFSQLEIPSEIWAMILDKVETDHASFWLALLTKPKKIDAWNEAITMRRSLSFPPIVDKVYNSKKVMNIIGKFPLLQKIKLFNGNLEMKYNNSSEMSKIEELSFYTDINPPIKCRGRKKNFLVTLDIEPSILKNIRILDVSNLDSSIANCYIQTLPIETKNNLAELKIDELTQTIIEQFPNLLKLTINKTDKLVHLNNNTSINDLSIIGNHWRRPIWEAYRNIKLFFRITSTRKIIYNGNIIHNECGISGMTTIEITISEKRVISLPFQQPVHTTGEETYIFTGILANNKGVGPFTKLTKSTGEIKTIKNLYLDKHGMTLYSPYMYK